MTTRTEQPSPTDPDRRRALTVLGISFAVIAVAAVVFAIGSRRGAVTEASSSHDADAVVLDLGSSGNVEVVAEPVDSITVERVERDTWGRLRTAERVEDGTLHLESSCVMGWLALFDDCRVDYVLRVPATTTLSGAASNGVVDVRGLRSGLDLRTSNGEMTIADTEGDIRLTTSNGDIEVVESTGELIVETDNGDVAIRDVSGERTLSVATSNGSIDVVDSAGDFDLSTSNGRITVDGATAGHVLAHTSNSAIDLRLTSSPERVEAITSNGQIDIEVPAGSPSYSLDLRANNGETVVGDVVDDPSAPRAIRAETDNGDIYLRTAP